MSKRWGTPTWYFFHTFAEKITENLFKNNRQECLQLLHSICSSLPCPYCKEHAIDYLLKHKFMEIKTKGELKNFFFNFHNEVNKRKKLNVQNLTILDKYKNASMINMYLYFKQEFFKTYYLANHFSGWIRNMLLEKVVKFFKKNISQFNP